MKRVIIVIPIHKELPSETELASFAQCFNTLGNHPITVLAPKDLNLQAYQNVIADFKTIFIDRDWLSSLEKYNKLKVNPFFYNLFRKYEYLLTYELDAWVFRDELKFWCDKGYDYIGAPWTGIYLYKNSPLLGVGNSGFSIRRVSKCIRILKNVEILTTLNQYKNLNWKGLIPRMPQFLLKLIMALNLSKPSFENNIQEDIFWCKFAPSLLNNINFKSILFKILAKILIKNKYKIAPKEIALQFSFETKVRELYELNNRKLPFGCHAWEKYDPEFWKAFIPNLSPEKLNA